MMDKGRISDEKAQRIAQEYAKVAFRDKTIPLIVMGYQPSYARSLGHKIYDNIKVKAEIEKIKAELSKKTGISEEKLIERMIDHVNCDNKGISMRACVELLHIKGAYELDNKQKQGPLVPIQVVVNNEKRALDQ